MKFTKYLVLAFVSLLFFACGKEEKKSETPVTPPKSMVEEKKADDGLGVGKTTKVVLNDPLNPDMVKNGKAIYEMKCAACHRLTDKRVVGPGWAGLTKKRKPEWIMNMITNVEMMLDEDPEAQKLLEECLTRMPNQNVSVEEARDILEFIYQNDKDQG